MEKLILNRAITTYGEDAQSDKAVEEAAELIKALMKFKIATNDSKTSTKTLMRRVNDVIDEISDVDIMIQQLKIIFGEADVEKRKRFKLRRLDRKLSDLDDFNPNPFFLQNFYTVYFKYWYNINISF